MSRELRRDLEVKNEDIDAAAETIAKLQSEAWLFKLFSSSDPKLKDLRIY